MKSESAKSYLVPCYTVEGSIKEYLTMKSMKDMKNVSVLPTTLSREIQYFQTLYLHELHALHG